jgi:hypothetical protein
MTIESKAVAPVTQPGEDNVFSPLLDGNAFGPCHPPAANGYQLTVAARANRVARSAGESRKARNVRTAP